MFRNIFFRINTLLGLDILPVVVLDGSCPEVKAATVSARNKQAWGERQNQQQSPSSAQGMRSSSGEILVDFRINAESPGYKTTVKWKK